MSDHLGKFPIEHDITVLPPKEEPLKIEFFAYEEIGSEVKMADDVEAGLLECGPAFQFYHLPVVRTLKLGDRISVPGFFHSGYMVATVIELAEKSGTAEIGRTLWGLNYDERRGWVSGCFADKDAIARCDFK